MKNKKPPTSSNKKRYEQLGMPIGTATHRLRKSIMFSMAKELNRAICYRCNQEIKTVKEFSIEHKIGWLDSSNPTELFFDLDNIAFSHLSCNSASKRYHKVRPHLRGEKIGISKLTDKKVLEIYRLRKEEKKTQKSIANQFDISTRLVRFIENKEIWKHIFTAMLS